MSAVDPISQLVEVLRWQHDIPVEWIERWSEGGKEPLAAAWEASSDVEAMLTLLSIARVKGAGLRSRGDRWTNTVWHRLKTSERTVLEYCLSEPPEYSQSMVAVYEYAFDDDGHCISSSKKSVMDFVHALRCCVTTMPSLKRLTKSLQYQRMGRQRNA